MILVIWQVAFGCKGDPLQASPKACINEGEEATHCVAGKDSRRGEERAHQGIWQAAGGTRGDTAHQTEWDTGNKAGKTTSRSQSNKIESW